MNKKTKTILVSPLKWGLGHSARLVPVIECCLERGWEVIIAADGRPLNFLRYHFPELSWFILPFPNIRYSHKTNLLRSLLPQLPSIVGAIRQNKRLVSEKVEEFGIDAIIGDHRYGVTHSKAPSVFITNQLWLIAPIGWRFAEWTISRIHLWSLRRFNYIWMADFPGDNNFTGKQTHLPYSLPKGRFIGPVSRFIGNKSTSSSVQNKGSLLVILSGPEPQRSILEKIIEDIFRNTNYQIHILRGLPQPIGEAINKKSNRKNIILIDHADDEYLASLIQTAEKIVCRPGLSMLSDLAVLGKTALLIPTPGQTEQNYMASRLAKAGCFGLVRQNELSLENIENFNPAKYKAFLKPDLTALNDALDELFVQ